MEISVYIATSLDGFIARENGDIDWLTNSDTEIEGEDYGYSDFFSTVTCLVMGRNTFDKVFSFPDWPYEGKRVVVMSSSLTNIPKPLDGSVELFSGTPEALITKLKSEGEQKLYIDGGRIVQSFLQAGFINKMIITRVPILIGNGLPLFGELKSDIKFEHIETKKFKSGLIQSSYKRRAIPVANEF